ncbi:MAG: urocanate hydratase [Flavobacteriales bacterium]|nr:urocanate hydratase [Flavobacteriales bacterium]
MSFKTQVTEGIPSQLPSKKERDPKLSHAPKRKDILNVAEKKLALRNALRYFPAQWHKELIDEFKEELKHYGRIYMYRFMPEYDMYARPIEVYPAKSQQAAAIMLMIQNNLDPAVAQHPQELITYGGNGAVFQNWAQYRLTMKYLSEMTEEQTLAMYSGHPMGLFPSHKDAPRVVVTNGMMIPNYSKPDDWEKFNALGVTQYGQMTAGSYMYIGPQGIVHGTTITVLNAVRKITSPDSSKREEQNDLPRPLLSKEGSLQTTQTSDQRTSSPPLGELEGVKLPLFVTSGLGGMSGAQPKAGNIAGVVTICAEINPDAANKRHSQGWVDEVIEDVDACIDAALAWQEKGEAHSIAYLGNIVDLWERLAERNIKVDLGSDQTSLHNPWAGGYYPVGLSYEESNALMASQPEEFKTRVQETLKRHVAAVNKLAKAGMYFFDYGNAFLLEAGRAGADVFAPTNSSLQGVKQNDLPQPLLSKEGSSDTAQTSDQRTSSPPLGGGAGGGVFRYPSYVQDIMGPMCFDFGFGPFRWVCTSGKPEDLEATDLIAAQVIEEMLKTAPEEIHGQLKDNLHWVREAEKNKLVVGSQARILYADAEGRIKIAAAFNKAIQKGKIGPVVLGRDHHDVSGTDSPYRETSNIYDGSQFTADMAVQNFVGDGFRGATWISLHNGGGVGWGEVINGGFGMLLDGSEDADRRLKMMLYWDVNNGISRRSWARNEGAVSSIKRAMETEPNLKVTLPNFVDDALLADLDM